MSSQREGAVQLSVPENWGLRRLDGPDHCASHAFKAVDFLVMAPGSHGEWLAVEIKGGELPCNPRFDREQYLTQLKTAPFLAHLVEKFRDTWIYLWLEEGENAARLRNYLVLLVLPKDKRPLEQPLLLALTDALRHRLPVGKPSRCRSRWQQALVQRIWIATPETWAAHPPEPWQALTISLTSC